MLGRKWADRLIPADAARRGGGSGGDFPVSQFSGFPVFRFSVKPRRGVLPGRGSRCAAGREADAISHLCGVLRRIAALMRRDGQRMRYGPGGGRSGAVLGWRDCGVVRRVTVATHCGTAAPSCAAVLGGTRVR